MTPEEHDAKDAAAREAARAALDRALGKCGWKFISAKTVRGAVIEYEIARLSDDRRATVRRLLSDIVQEGIVDDELRALCAARGEPYIELPVSMLLMLALVNRAKEINAEGVPPGGPKGT